MSNNGPIQRYDSVNTRIHRDTKKIQHVTKSGKLAETQLDEQTEEHLKEIMTETVTKVENDGPYILALLITAFAFPIVGPLIIVAMTKEHPKVRTAAIVVSALQISFLVIMFLIGFAITMSSASTS